MDVTLGQRQTEAGVIPEDWRVAELHRICRETITYGIVQCGPHVENGVPYIRVSDMDARELDVNRMLRTSPSIASKFGRSTVVEGDIVYALRGKLGEVRQITETVTGANLTQGTARLSPNNETVSSAYLLWALRSPQSLRQAELEAKGTTFREITLADLRQLAIPIPSLIEQDAIAEALSDADAIVASLEQLLAKKRQLKQGAMQELLAGKRRLPGFQKNTVCKQTEMGLVPADWDSVSIDDVAVKIGSGITPTGGSSNYRENGRPFVRSQNVGWGALLLDDLVYIDDDTHRTFSGTELRCGDVLLNITGASIGRCAMADERLAGGNVNQHVCIVRTDPSRADGLFIGHLLLSDIGQRQIDSFQAGGNREDSISNRFDPSRYPFPRLKKNNPPLPQLSPTWTRRSPRLKRSSRKSATSSKA